MPAYSPEQTVIGDYTPEKQNRIHEYTIEAPFAQDFLWSLKHGLLKNSSLSAAASQAQKYDGGLQPDLILQFPAQKLLAYLGWEEVAHGRCLRNGTGFEGYFADAQHPELLEQQLLSIGTRLLDMISKQYRWEGGKQRRFIRALNDRQFDPEAMHFWNAALGTELGRLRAVVLTSSPLRTFRQETQSLISGLPLPRVVVTNGTVQYEYSLIHEPVLDVARTVNSDERMVVDRITDLCSVVARELLAQS